MLMTVHMGGSAIADHPAMLALWDAEANAGLDPARLAARSSQPKRWRCGVAEDHRWSASPVSIANSLAKGFTGCPCCAGRQLSVTNSFAGRHPEGVALWHPTANGDLRPEQVLGGSPGPVWWKCPKGPDHEWQCSPLVLGTSSLARGASGCPYCAGKRASVTNNILSQPQLHAEWHPTLNDRPPEEVVASTRKKLWWRCLENPAHEWPASGSNRVRGRGCPLCRTHLRSILEVCLAFELQLFFPELDLTDDKVVIGGVVRHVDLLLRDQWIVIEVDGRYRHDGPVELQRDRRKTELLTDAGYRVLRLRESPLTQVTSADVVVPKDPTVKQATDAVLVRLRDLGWVELLDVAAYLAETEPRRLAESLDSVRVERPGRQVRAPGPASFTRSQRWDQGLSALLTYVNREGHANVPFEHVEGGFALGAWVGGKRGQRRRGRLDPSRAALLTGLPGWTWDAVKQQWEDGFAHLLAFQDREGHPDVPAQYCDDDGFPLGSWVRSHRRRGGRRTMTTNQRQRLEAVPGWTYAPVTQSAWERAAVALETFAGREGHCRIPRDHREAGVDLDSWTKQQRGRYRSGKLAADRVERLQRIPGWSWFPQDDAWEAGFVALQRCVTKTGSAALRRNEQSDGYPVGAWVGEQRNRRTRGLLDPDRATRLEALPGWTWDPLTDAWERHYDALLGFVAREGHARVPTHHVEASLPLADWVIRHRQEHKAGKVPADQVKRLEALPGWTWDVLAARWEEQFEALLSYSRREGHARVPGGHLENGIGLGAWVVVQRHNHRKAGLSAERADRLEGVTGWVWDARDAAWEAGFGALRQFYRRTGHCEVPWGWLEDGYRLGQWVGVQRGLLRGGKLAGDRRRKLCALPGWHVAPG
jgi:hypothetical protein